MPNAILKDWMKQRARLTRRTKKAESEAQKSMRERFRTPAAAMCGQMADKRLGLAAASCAVLALVLQSLMGAEEVPLKPIAEAGRSVTAIQVVQLQGKVVCLAEEMHRMYETPLPTDHAHLYAFKTNEGQYFTLLRTRTSEALFADPVMREKELILKGRVFPQTQVLEVTSMKSVKNGVIHDLYYYCVICDIIAIVPEICDCCQGPTELVEKPLR